MIVASAVSDFVVEAFKMRIEGESEITVERNYFLSRGFLRNNCTPLQIEVVNSVDCCLTCPSYELFCSSGSRPAMPYVLFCFFSFLSHRHLYPQ